MHADAAPVQPLAAPCVALFALLTPHKRGVRPQVPGGRCFLRAKDGKEQRLLAALEKDARVLSIKEQLPRLD